MNHIEIKSERASGLPTIIKLNGKELKDVRLVNYHMEVDSAPRVTIEFNAPTVEIDVIAEMEGKNNDT